MHNNWYVDNIEKNWFSGVTRLNYVRFCFAKKTYLKREHNVCLLVLVDLHSGLISKDEDEQSKALICKERFRRLINGWSPVTTWLLSNYCDNAVNDLSKICHGFQSRVSSSRASGKNSFWADNRMFLMHFKLLHLNMPDKLSQILWKEKKKRALSTDGPITGHQSKKNLKKTFNAMVK